jgi:membrane protease YdiL (CAAX protease family)
LLNTYIQKFEAKLNALHWSLFIASFAALRILVAILFFFIVQHFGMQLPSGELDEIGNIVFSFLVIVIIAPLVETYLVQFLPFRFLSNKIQPIVLMFISAVIFGLMHHQRIGYMLYGFCGGMVYAFAYYVKRRSRPLLITTAIHSLFNLFVFVYNHL